MNVYTERTLLLALLACHYPAHVCPATDPEPGFEHIVCIHISGRQHAWHVSDEDMEFMMHLPRRDSHYDGHSTDDKYDSIWAYIIERRATP